MISMTEMETDWFGHRFRRLHACIPKIPKHFDMASFSWHLIFSFWCMRDAIAFGIKYQVSFLNQLRLLKKERNTETVPL